MFFSHASLYTDVSMTFSHGRKKTHYDLRTLGSWIDDSIILITISPY